MRLPLIFPLLFLISGNISFAQCGYHRENLKEQISYKSSISISEDTKDLKKLATIVKKHAEKFAKSQYNGKVKKAELETKDGTLVWKINIKGNQGTKELFIDPANGAFLGYGLTK